MKTIFECSQAKLVLRAVILAFFGCVAFSAFAIDESHATGSQGVKLRQCDSFRMEFDSSIVVDEALMSSICAYYDSENAADWEKAYLLRTENFRRIVRLEPYAKQMSKDKRGVNVARIRWLAMDEVGLGRIVLKGDFYEEISTGKGRQEAGAGLVTRNDKTLWINDGNWKCAECARRSRYGLNISFDYRD